MASIGFHKRHSGHRIASVTPMNCDVGSTQGVCGELQTVHNGHGPCIQARSIAYRQTPQILSPEVKRLVMPSDLRTDGHKVAS